MEKIMEFFKSVGDSVGLSQDVVMYISIGIVALVFIAIIAIIAVAVKKSKQRKATAAKKAVKTVSVQPAVIKPTVSPVQQQATTATVAQLVEVVKEEKPAEKEPVKENKPAPKQAPVKVEKKAEQTKKVIPKKQAKEEAEKPSKKLFGKWVVELKSEDEYMSALLASNGEIMLSSEIYTTEEGARNGIATIIKGVDNGKFVIYQDKNKNYYYKLKTVNNRLLCVGEIYKAKDQCLKAVETVKRIAAGSAISSELVSGARYIDYTPAEIPAEKKGVKGKWRVELNENGTYSARLYASNGQLMLATEEVASKKSAENAVVSVKKNALEGNFIIDRDKFGRFYYKLRNVQKSVICIGEAYDTLESCNNAIESVRRFATQASEPTKDE